ncbi:MAG: hypothetical protein M1837_004739 [Sclerophora amabilis]|nr:MAG: hypothetical protein M1837_004739 [Sclerophora amabilis]
MLSLARVPLPRIGSFTINDEGVLSLINRPLTLRLQALENEGIPTYMDKNLTYSTMDSYLLDLLAYHDSRLLHQPNSIYDEDDCRQQMAVLSIMRSIVRNFVDSSLRHGPFFISLTDIHQSNIFVDSNWNIKCLIDLEWTCSMPIGMAYPPHWLTDRGVDQLVDEHLVAYNKVREEFMKIFESEERLSCPTNHALIHTSAIKQVWENGGFWYFAALESTKGMYNIFHDHIRPLFDPPSILDAGKFERTLSSYWSPHVEKTVSVKMKDKARYENELRDAFEADQSPSPSPSGSTR